MFSLVFLIFKDVNVYVTCNKNTYLFRKTSIQVFLFLQKQNECYFELLRANIIITKPQKDAKYGETINLIAFCPRYNADQVLFYNNVPFDGKSYFTDCLQFIKKDLLSSNNQFINILQEKKILNRKKTVF